MCAFLNPSVPDSPIKVKCEGWLLQMMCWSDIKQLKILSSFIVAGSHMLLAANKGWYKIQNSGNNELDKRSEAPSVRFLVSQSGCCVRYAMADLHTPQQREMDWLPSHSNRKKLCLPQTEEPCVSSLFFDLGGIWRSHLKFSCSPRMCLDFCSELCCGCWVRTSCFPVGSCCPSALGTRHNGNNKGVVSRVLDYLCNGEQNLHQFKCLFQWHLCCKGRRGSLTLELWASTGRFPAVWRTNQLSTVCVINLSSLNTPDLLFPWMAVSF